MWSTAHVSLCRQELEKLLIKHPHLKKEVNFTIFEEISLGSHITIQNKVIIINLSGLTGKIHYYQTQERKTLMLLSLISRKLKLLFVKYPHLRAELGMKIYEFVITHVFDEAMSLDELERLVEVIKYKAEVVRVENVYQFTSERSNRKIFYLRTLIKTLLDELNRLRLNANLELLIEEAVLGLIRVELIGIV